MLKVIGGVLAVLCALLFAAPTTNAALRSIGRVTTGSIAIEVVDTAGEPVRMCSVGVLPLDEGVAIRLEAIYSGGTPTVFRVPFGRWEANVDCGVEAQFYQHVTPVSVQRTVVLDAHDPHAQVRVVVP
ncbi:hypothetical protein [Bifidobacterium cuniculi]|uniref:Secreted protein n=1 Tax=Bifidobacterium cuniculi TaxID=1688 RepID=A0A087B3B0_9BIFI|nr:hypothetical protein [Bifidobacterium cuniculi]KFI65510.1 hypothetical protein BCUN_0002 [Bifidobacterium cuniculi]